MNKRFLVMIHAHFYSQKLNNTERLSDIHLTLFTPNIWNDFIKEMNSRNDSDASKTCFCVYVGKASEPQKDFVGCISSCVS